MAVNHGDQRVKIVFNVYKDLDFEIYDRILNEVQHQR